MKRESNTLLRIFVTEGDAFEGRPLHRGILEKARARGIKGCTVFKGCAGFGPNGVLHSDFPPDYAVDLPVLIELVDTAENTDAFLAEIEPVLGSALVTEEKVR